MDNHAPMSQERVQAVAVGRVEAQLMEGIDGGHIAQQLRHANQAQPSQLRRE